LLKNGARRRPLYEDQDARISILANSEAERPDTFWQIVQAGRRKSLADGAGHTFSTPRPTASARRAAPGGVPKAAAFVAPILPTRSAAIVGTGGNASAQDSADARSLFMTPLLF
jgi:hypothetical protein